MSECKYPQRIWAGAMETDTMPGAWSADKCPWQVEYVRADSVDKALKNARLMLYAWKEWGEHEELNRTIKEIEELLK